jgi:hypothetical protein
VHIEEKVKIGNYIYEAFLAKEINQIKLKLKQERNYFFVVAVLYFAKS